VRECEELLVWVKSEGYRLPGVLHVPHSAEKAEPIVLLHGFTGSKVEAGRLFVDLARMLCREGHAVLRFDYRGHGDAPLLFEDFDISYAIADSVNAVRYIVGETNSRNVGLVGLSMGGGVAVRVSTTLEEVKALALLSPALDFTQLTSRIPFRLEKGYMYLGALRLKAANAVRLFKFSVMELAPRVQVPTLIIHAVDDEIVPIDQARRFYERLEVEKRLIEVRGGHVFNDYHVRQRVLSEIAEWMKEHLGGR